MNLSSVPTGGGESVFTTRGESPQGGLLHGRITEQFPPKRRQVSFPAVDQRRCRTLPDVGRNGRITGPLLQPLDGVAVSEEKREQQRAKYATAVFPSGC